MGILLIREGWNLTPMAIYLCLLLVTEPYSSLLLTVRSQSFLLAVPQIGSHSLLPPEFLPLSLAPACPACCSPSAAFLPGGGFVGKTAVRRCSSGYHVAAQPDAPSLCARPSQRNVRR